MSHGIRRNPQWWAGVGLAVAVAFAAVPAADWIGTSLLGFDRSPISAIVMAIAIGTIVANTITLPPSMSGGIRFCARTILRVGIILLGIRLSLGGTGQFTLVALPFVIIAITIGLTAVGLIGRSMGLSLQLSGLIAVGTSICGVTAIVATAPLIKAKETEVGYAAACITVFGLGAMFLYPLLGHLLFDGRPELVGLFLGTSIHETAQVAGAGLMYETQFHAPRTLDIATVTKLVRNLCMIAVIPLVGILYSADHRSHLAEGRVNWRSVIPWFILGFALMSAVRTIGDAGDRAFGLFDPVQWEQIVTFTRDTAEWCLLIAMSAVGLTSLVSDMRHIGMRPFALGLFAAALVGGVSLGAIALLAERLIAFVGL